MLTPGLAETSVCGQVLTIPSNSSNYNNDNYNNYNGSNGYNAYNGYNGNPYTTIMFDQRLRHLRGPAGDTFGDIANRYGVSINDLSNDNPYIGNEDLLYPDRSSISRRHRGLHRRPRHRGIRLSLNQPTVVMICATHIGCCSAVDPSQSQPAQPWYGSYPPSLVARILWICAHSNKRLRQPLAYGQVSPGSPTVGRTIVQ